MRTELGTPASSRKMYMGRSSCGNGKLRRGSKENWKYRCSGGSVKFSDSFDGISFLRSVAFMLGGAEAYFRLDKGDAEEGESLMVNEFDEEETECRQGVNEIRGSFFGGAGRIYWSGRVVRGNDGGVFQEWSEGSRDAAPQVHRSANRYCAVSFVWHRPKSRSIQVFLSSIGASKMDASVLFLWVPRQPFETINFYSSDKRIDLSLLEDYFRILEAYVWSICSPLRYLNGCQTDDGSAQRGHRFYTSYISVRKGENFQRKISFDS